MSIDPIIYQQEPRIFTPRERMRAHISLIAASHGVSLGEVMGAGRTRKVIRARNEAIRYVWDLMWVNGDWSYPDIGRFFGKDHSTIMFALGRLSTRKPSLWVSRERSEPTVSA